MRKLLGFCLILSLFVLPILAQPTPDNTQYDLGVECPIAQTLSADGTTLWILMVRCFRDDSHLVAYDLTDGSQVEVELPDNLTELLASLFGQATYSNLNVMTFLDDEETILSIRYNDAETYQPLSLVVSLTDGGVIEPDPSDEQVGELLLSLTDYPESAIYSPSHTLAAVTEADVLSVVDLPSGEVIFNLPLEVEYNGYPSFSADGTRLYVGAFTNPNDMDNYAATLSVYSLPDGELLATYDAPSAFVWVSPDERYAVGETGASDSTRSDLYITDLTTGETSGPIALYEPSRRLVACTNDGRNMSDVDFTVDGRLSLVDVSWLPDSSGFAYTRSYGGDGAGGGLPCSFDTSRLNIVRLGE